MTFKIHPLPPMPLLADPPPWNRPTGAPGEPEAIGRSVLGNSINLFNGGRANGLVMAGVHGDESEGIFMAHLLLAEGCPVPLIPCINPDGAFLRQRWNAHNVDLNRNLPSRDWKPEPLNPRYPPGPEPGSEPENQALFAALERVRPSTVLSLHSFKESFVEIERPPETLPAEINRTVDTFVEAVGIERRLSVGYPTPGAMGSYGLENDLLILTWELRRGASHGELHALLPHVRAFVEDLNRYRFAVPEA